MAWIGGLKAFQYEADGIVPFVINSPFMNFFYQNTGETAINDKGEVVAEYTLHKNPEGKTVRKNINWHTENGTYAFSYGLGTVIVRSEEHTSELQSLMRISYAVFCLKKKITKLNNTLIEYTQRQIY